MEGTHIHISGFTNRENNQFQKKLINKAEVEYMNIAPLNYRYVVGGINFPRCSIIT